ncbi:MAG: hypothetical protein J6C37_08025 [Roseburia sp.]|nr:hypothetical protein [Roseburia sp.]
MPETFFHHAKQVFDTGLELNLLQEYVMIPLDIFKDVMQNKSVTTPLEAWLTFLSEDDPEKIISLITNFPEFKPMYETAYQLCRNIERVMGLFSEELRELDRNTVMYMIEQQQQLEEKDAQLEQQNAQLEQMNVQLKQKDAQLKQQNAQLNKQAEEIAALKQAFAQLQSPANKKV